MKTSEIKKAFEALSQVFNSKTTNWAEKLLDQCVQEEREHRGFMDGFNAAHTSDTIGVKDAARLFAVKRVAEYLGTGAWPAGQDYLHMQKSCFTAAGIADEFGDEIRAIWSAELIKELAALDYTDFVKVNKAA